MKTEINNKLKVSGRSFWRIIARNGVLLLAFGFSAVTIYSCVSKEEQEKKRLEKAKIERENFIKDSLQEASVKFENERLRLQKVREDSIAKAAHMEKVKNSVKITSYYLSSPNSASGVSANLYYKNLSDKPIKYLTWTGHAINDVGDVVSCTIRDYTSFSGQDTGPIKKGGSGGGCWDCAWYNWQAKKMILTSVAIEYMDGSTFDIEGDDLYLIGKKK